MWVIVVMLLIALSVLPALAAADACGNVPYALGGEQISPPKSSSAKARTSTHTQDAMMIADTHARYLICQLALRPDAMMIATHASI